MRQRENNMAIRYRQDLRRPITQPLISRSAVALGAMTVTARSVGDRLMPAMITLLHLRPECGGAARADVSECLPLLGRQYISPAKEELLTVLAEDIGDFQPMFCHRRRPSPSVVRISRIGRLSSGLTVARNLASDTCRYRAVVSRSAWPSSN